MINIEHNPVSWTWTTLEGISEGKDGIVDGPFGSNLRSQEYTEHGTPVFKIQNIKPLRFLDKKICFISNEKAKVLRRHSFQTGDLIITKLGDPLGVCCSVPKKYPFGIIVADLIRLRPDREKVYPAYLELVINSKIVQDQFKRVTKGTTRPRVNLTIVRKIKIPLPKLDEQKLIVEKIEELFSELDTGRRQLEVVKKQLITYRQSVLKFAYEGKFTKTKFVESKTGNIVDIINNGYTPSREFLSEDFGDIPFIKVYNLNFNGTLNFKKNPTFIPKDIHKKQLKRSICLPGDVLINIVGPPLGKVSIVTDQFPEWNINQAIVMFRPNEKVISKFLSYFLQNSATINWLEETSKATAGQWNVKVSTCREIPIPICSPVEQEIVVNEIESRLSVCEKLEEIIETCLQQSEALKQSVLKQAFEGKLVKSSINCK